MVFTKHLREGVRRGRIRCSVRIWTRPHVKVGGRYPMDEGQIVVDSLVPMSLADITDDLARQQRMGRQSIQARIRHRHHGPVLGLADPGLHRRNRSAMLMSPREPVETVLL